MRVAIYARVSTQNHGQDVGMQPASFANTPSAAAGPLPASMSTSA